MALFCLFSLAGCGDAPVTTSYSYAVLDGEVVTNYKFTYSADKLNEAAEELFIAYFSDKDDEVYMITAALPSEMCTAGLTMTLSDFTDSAELRLTHVSDDVYEYSASSDPEVFSDVEFRIESYSKGATAQFYIKAEFTVDEELLSYEGCSDILMKE